MNTDEGKNYLGEPETVTAQGTPDTSEEASTSAGEPQITPETTEEETTPSPCQSPEYSAAEAPTDCDSIQQP